MVPHAQYTLSKCSFSFLLWSSQGAVVPDFTAWHSIGAIEIADSSANKDLPSQVLALHKERPCANFSFQQETLPLVSM